MRDNLIIQKRNFKLILYNGWRRFISAIYKCDIKLTDALKNKINIFYEIGVNYRFQTLKTQASRKGSDYSRISLILKNYCQIVFLLRIVF